jgi:hypothetical protein
MMKLHISDQDSRAMALLLDRSAIAAGKIAGKSIYAAADGQMRQSVATFAKVLVLLDNLPAEDPPRGLASRTLRRVEQSSGRKVAEAQPAHFNQPPVG